MTTCDHTRNRLLALADPASPTAVVRDHLADCPACRAYQGRLSVLDADLLALPAPSSELAKAAFLDTLTAAGPVIRTRPTLPAGWSLRDVLSRFATRPVAGVAAAALVGVGVWAPWRERPPTVEPVGPRHELVQRVVSANVELAKVSDPKQRVVTLANLAADVGDEAAALALAADADEMRTMVGMFDKLVNEGVVNQARQVGASLDPAIDRQRALRAAKDRLAAVAAGLGRVPTNAASRPAVDEMTKTAAAAQATLARLEKGEI